MSLADTSKPSKSNHLSVFDIFKIGIGPSSSHTMGPMLASVLFIQKLKASNLLTQLHSLNVELYGSLALTGIGHCTDKAIILGLEGERAETIDASSMDAKVDRVHNEKTLHLGKEKWIPFDPKVQLIFLRRKSLPLHPNAMCFKAIDSNQQTICEQVFYSIGGGAVRTHEDMQHPTVASHKTNIPFLFNSAEQLLKIGKTEQLSFEQIMIRNETIKYSPDEIEKRLDLIWKTMDECIDRGCHRDGILPGKLKVKRRAALVYKDLIKNPPLLNDPLSVLDWVNLFALAVNEENASASKIVTAPTNGASGIIPAVIKYYQRFCQGNPEGIRRFLLSSGAIGILYAKNASISGAEVGCQGEVGVACSMAAGGLVAALNGSNEQIEQAAEIGMEHNLGLTCDPIGGLVQIPCIERNAMGAVKAINASRIAMKGDGQHYVSLDSVMKTMMQTGADMKTKYKETSRGGLAVNIPEC